MKRKLPWQSFVQAAAPADQSLVVARPGSAVTVDNESGPFIPRQWSRPNTRIQGHEIGIARLAPLAAPLGNPVTLAQKVIEFYLACSYEADLPPRTVPEIDVYG